MTNNNDMQRWCLGAVLVLCLTGCSNHDRDLADFIAKLQTTTTHTKTDLTAIRMPAPVAYQASQMRDPFEDTATSYTEKSMVNPVNAFPLNMLRYTGMIGEDGQTWAVILVPDGRIYQVKLNDVIGDRNGVLMHIAPDHIEVSEPVTEENKQASSRLVILRLKEGT